ncbi:MAG: FHA domain-containing protein, partial [Nannocystaceae bacterium]|nr:FHA domain-containing protein [Nannocystaceae bacterium]
MRVRVTISGPDGHSDRAPEFTKAEITIGRRPTNDVVIPDASASGAHARVMVTGGALTILDLDSTNGTAVNSEPLQGPRLLDDGDVVEIGDFSLRFALNKSGGTVASQTPDGAGPGSDVGP